MMQSHMDSLNNLRRGDAPSQLVSTILYPLVPNPSTLGPKDEQAGMTLGWLTGFNVTVRNYMSLDTWKNVSAH